MKSKQIQQVIGSAALGVVMFLFLWARVGLLPGVFGGGIAMLLCLLYLLKTTQTREAALARLQGRLGGVELLNSASASIKDGRSELSGLLAITADRVVFETLREHKGSLEFTYPEIKYAGDNAGFLLLTDQQDITYKFKMFQAGVFARQINKQRNRQE